jgi:glucose-6-phosphate isomerase
VLALQEKVVAFVRKAGSPVGVKEIAAGVGSPEEVETVFKIVRRLAVNERMTIERGPSLFEDRYHCA